MNCGPSNKNATPLAECNAAYWRGFCKYAGRSALVCTGVVGVGGAVVGLFGGAIVGANNNTATPKFFFKASLIGSGVVVYHCLPYIAGIALICGLVGGKRAKTNMIISRLK